MREKKIKVGILIILLIAFSFIFHSSFLNLEDNSITEKNLEKLEHSGELTNTKQWIVNGNFSSSDNWTSAKGNLGDPEDVDAAISGGTANFTINGESGKYSISGTPNSSWTAYNNTDWGVGMDEGTERGIDNYGCWVSYTWDENTDQTGGTPSVHWKRNITLPVSMSDYKIISASLNVTFNATVTATDPGGIDVFNDQTNLQVGDYARFYVLISDVENVYQPFQVANNRTKYLGWNTGPVSTIIDTSLTNIDETLLINYLELILGVNSTTFTITLGIDIFCEDNIGGNDLDIWDKLRINFINLSFIYERNIDQLTSVSWNQEGDKPSDIITNPFVINEAILNFKYKNNDTWSKASSPNSELKILINNIPHSETIKLWSAETTFQNASINGFDVTRLIDKNKDINVSIQLYLADELDLNRTITFSIDDIYLNITYTEEITDIETKLQLFLNGIDKTNDPDPGISLPLGEELNITIRYTNKTDEYISLADVNLEGKVSGTFDPDPTFEQYNLTINTNDIGIGVSILTVIADKPFYEINQTQFFVEVTERETELLLYLDGIQKYDGETINVKGNETVNITVYYRDKEYKQHLPNAIVNLVGWGQLNETNNQYYNTTIKTDDLDLGINAFTIFAQLVNYTSNSTNFFIEVTERETKLLLFLNDAPKDEGDTIIVDIDATINITVYYRDNETGDHLINATVNLIGWAHLNETDNQYTLIIDAKDLDQGITVLTVFAQKYNYKSQSIDFFVEVIQKATTLQLFLNGDDKTLDPVFNLTIGELLNITIKYTELSGTDIPHATVQLIGEGILINLTRESEFNQYYKELNTLNLKVGVNLFSIIAFATNYEIQTIKTIITLNRISTLINISSQINAKPGEDVTLRVDLYDIYFGGTIKNATVTYRWAYGQGEFVDIYNNGSYQIVLENVPKGTYTITISAFAGNNYDFESKEITLIVTSPEVKPGPDLSWVIYLLVGGMGGLVIIFTLYQTHFKYPPMVRKIKSLKKKIRKNRKLNPLTIQNREEIVENAYKKPIDILELKHEPVEKITEKEPEKVIDSKKTAILDKIDKLDKKE